MLVAAVLTCLRGLVAGYFPLGGLVAVHGAGGFPVAECTVGFAGRLAPMARAARGLEVRLIIGAAFGHGDHMVNFGSADFADIAVAELPGPAVAAQYLDLDPVGNVAAVGPTAGRPRRLGLPRKDVHISRNGVLASA
jgi:hypothetical protein